jgi:hypothetical protein
VLPGVTEKALAESERISLTYSGAWEDFEELKSTGDVDQSVWKVCVWLPDQFTIY